MSITDAVLINGSHNGERIAYIGPQLRESLPPLVLEGLVRRRLVATTGLCPCGARMHVPNRATRRAAARAGRAFLGVEVQHETGCPALDPRLDALGPLS